MSNTPTHDHPEMTPDQDQRAADFAGRAARALAALADRDLPRITTASRTTPPAHHELAFYMGLLGSQADHIFGSELTGPKACANSCASRGYRREASDAETLATVARGLELRAVVLIQAKSVKDPKVLAAVHFIQAAAAALDAAGQGPVDAEHHLERAKTLSLGGTTHLANAASRPTAPIPRQATGQDQ